MQTITVERNAQTIDYKGAVIPLNVLGNVLDVFYLAADKDGSVWVYDDLPVPDSLFPEFKTDNGNDSLVLTSEYVKEDPQARQIRRVSVEDWRSSCVKYEVK